MEKRSSTYRLMALVIVVVLILAAPSLILGQSGSSASTGGMHASTWMDMWPVRLILNLLGYAAIVVPGYLIIRFIRKTKYLSSAGNGYIPTVLRLCINGSIETDKVSLEQGPLINETSELRSEPSFMKKLGQLLFCSGGLLCSYLVWGLLQERIMAFEYGATDGNPGIHFKNSQFLVFMNRILALVFAALVVWLRPQPKHRAPVYKYSYSSFSNILSSWFQYEALKFVSFPTQVLAKASKVIPVMLMGKLVSRKTFEYHEYLTALMISAGVSMFVLTSKDTSRNSTTTFSGVVLLGGYLFFDAFTSNWQGKLYDTYKMSSTQMMLGVNLFSVLFTSTTLVEQNTFLESFAFMATYPMFMFHVMLLSICSATGQLFIFHTIDVFGPVTFTIIMTIRQGLAILLSCLVFSHPVTITGALGIIIIFVAIFSRTYLNHIKRRKARASVSMSISTDKGAALSLPTSIKA